MCMRRVRDLLEGKDPERKDAEFEDRRHMHASLTRRSPVLPLILTFQSTPTPSHTDSPASPKIVQWSSACCRLYCKRSLCEILAIDILSHHARPDPHPESSPPFHTSHNGITDSECTKRLRHVQRLRPSASRAFGPPQPGMMPACITLVSVPVPIGPHRQSQIMTSGLLGTDSSRQLFHHCMTEVRP
jgi:hypothetical protein